MTNSPGADQLTTDHEIFGRHAIDLAVHDAEVAHQLFDDIRNDGGIVGLSEPLEHIGMFQQRNRSQRDHVGGGFVAGLHHDHTVHGRGGMVELARRDVFGNQTADQVVARFAFFALHQLLDIGIHRPKGLPLLLVGGPLVQPLGGVLLEEAEIFRRHPQQQRDHQ